MNMSSARNYGLDVMRTAAILLVLIGHGSHFLDLSSDSIAYAIIQPVTFMGVEIFFVLSGFLIGRALIAMYEERNVTVTSVMDFWKRRWFRTLPNYYLFLFVNVLGFSLFKDGFEFDWRYLFFLQNFVSLNESFFSVSWSLSVEEWFYLTLPVLLLAIGWGRGRYPSFLVVIAVYFTLIFMLRLLAIVEYDLAWNDELRKIVVFRVDSILVGVLASWFFYRYIDFFKKYRYGFAIVSLLSLLGILTVMEQGLLGLKMVQLIFYPCLSIAIALILPYLFFFRDRRNAMGAWVRRTSLWSYSLYLSHVPLLEAIHILGPKFGYPVVDQSWGYFTISVWIIVAFIVSALVYRFWEAPMLSLRDYSVSGWLREALGGARGR